MNCWMWKEKKQTRKMARFLALEMYIKLIPPRNKMLTNTYHTCLNKEERNKKAIIYNVESSTMYKLLFI